MCVCDFIECLKFTVVIEFCSHFLSLYTMIDVVIRVSQLGAVCVCVISLNV